MPPLAGDKLPEEVLMQVVIALVAAVLRGLDIVLQNRNIQTIALHIYISGIVVFNVELQLAGGDVEVGFRRNINGGRFL